MAVPVFEGEKVASLEFQSTRAYSPPAFVTASGRPKYDQAFTALFGGFEHPKLQREDWGFLTPFGRETSPRNVGRANVCKIQCCMLANDGHLHKKRPDQAI